MKTLGVLAAGGFVSWILRVAFIDFVPAGWLPKNLSSALRHVPPSAFAALVSVAVAAAATGAGPLSGWPVVAAAATTVIVARCSRYPALALMTGAITATAFAAL